LGIDLPDTLPAVLGDRVQLQQVILNLLMNAFEALDGDDRSVKPVLIRTAVVDGMITVEVEDDGIGLTDDQLPRMFEPFYTTKPGGMGLGLAICQTIVSAHDGSVTVSRNASRGTTFSFSLPARAASEAVTAAIESRRVS
jgi:signal transduction histidine kinase